MKKGIINICMGLCILGLSGCGEGESTTKEHEQYNVETQIKPTEMAAATPIATVIPATPSEMPIVTGLPTTKPKEVLQFLEDKDRIIAGKYYIARLTTQGEVQIAYEMFRQDDNVLDMQWKDVTKLVKYDTFPLAQSLDGTLVVPSGCAVPEIKDKYTKPTDEEWEDVVSCVSGADMLFGLKQDGTVIHTKVAHQPEYSYNTEAMKDIVFIAVGYDYRVRKDVVFGIRKDGKVVNHFGEELSGFEDIIEIDVKTNFGEIVVGMKVDGTICISEDADKALKLAVKEWNGERITEEDKKLTVTVYPETYVDTNIREWEVGDTNNPIYDSVVIHNVTLEGFDFSVVRTNYESNEVESIVPLSTAIFREDGISAVSDTEIGTLIFDFQNNDYSLPVVVSFRVEGFKELEGLRFSSSGIPGFEYG